MSERDQSPDRKSVDQPQPLRLPDVSSCGLGRLGHEGDGSFIDTAEVSRNAHQLFGGDPDCSILDDHLNPYPGYPVLMTRDGHVGVILVKDDHSPMAMAIMDYHIAGTQSVDPDPNLSRVLGVRAVNGGTMDAAGFTRPEMVAAFVEGASTTPISTIRSSVGESLDLLGDLIELPRFDDPEKAARMAQEYVQVDRFGTWSDSLTAEQSPFPGFPVIIDRGTGLLGFVIQDKEGNFVGRLLTTAKLGDDGAHPSDIGQLTAQSLSICSEATDVTSVINLSDYDGGQEFTFTCSALTSAPTYRGTHPLYVRTSVATELGLLESTPNLAEPVYRVGW